MKNFMIMSSVETLHGELKILQRNVYSTPPDPVKSETGFEGSTIVAPLPFTILQLPVPITGAFAESIADIPQMD